MEDFRPALLINISFVVWALVSWAIAWLFYKSTDGVLRKRLIQLFVSLGVCATFWAIFYPTPSVDGWWPCLAGAVSIVPTSITLFRLFTHLYSIHREGAK